MSATTGLSVTMQVDAALDAVVRQREYVMAERPSARRSATLAELYELEAKSWAVLSEHTRTRVHWRAALSAREHAHQSARSWRRRAAMQRAEDAGGAA